MGDANDGHFASYRSAGRRRRASVAMLCGNFSASTSAPRALASAEANVPIDGLDRCIAVTQGIDEVETDGP